jgi:hypothetical protein
MSYDAADSGKRTFHTPAATTPPRAKYPLIPRASSPAPPSNKRTTALDRRRDENISCRVSRGSAQGRTVRSSDQSTDAGTTRLAALARVTATRCCTPCAMRHAPWFGRRLGISTCTGSSISPRSAWSIQSVCSARKTRPERQGKSGSRKTANPLSHWAVRIPLELL